ncbi:hypothetical protein J3A83DRAFT_4189676 [Scleroderma citrinum]
MVSTVPIVASLNLSFCGEVGYLLNLEGEWFTERCDLEGRDVRLEKDQFTVEQLVVEVLHERLPGIEPAVILGFKEPVQFCLLFVTTASDASCVRTWIVYSMVAGSIPARYIGEVFTIDELRLLEKLRTIYKPFEELASRAVV